MGTYNSYYINNRPLVEVFIQNSKDSFNLGLSQRYHVLLDTGATITCISLKLAKKLGLEAIGEIDYFSASGRSKSKKYRISITFLFNLKPRNQKKTEKVFDLPKEMVVFQKEVLGIPLANEKIDLLIGIDLISEGNFYLNNDYFSFEIPKKKFVINFPKNKTNYHISSKPKTSKKI